MSVGKHVEGCAYRDHVQGEGAAETAECRLLGTITGVADSALTTVARDVCEFCCRSVPPTPRQVNPVLGSALYALTRRVVALGGVPGCDAEKASELQAWSRDFLDWDPTDVDAPGLPLASVESCYHLGRVRGFRVGNHGGEFERVSVHACLHPDHSETTRAGCVLCRDWTDRPRARLGARGDGLPPIPEARSGDRVRTWSVGVTTSPRRRPTLEMTLDSLVRAGWDEARLFIDSAVTVPERHARFPITYREPRLGAWPNFYLGLSELRLRDPDADAYMMIQDDVSFHDRVNLREHLESILWPGDAPGPISLYSSQVDARARFGWAWHEAGWFRGALAFVFPRSLVRQFLTDELVVAHRRSGRHDGLANVDTVVGSWAHRNGTPIGFPTPSLCRHIGHASTLWPGGKVAEIRKEGPFAGDLPAADGPDRGDGAFPEHAFPCPENRERDYVAQVERGYARMRDRSIAICGLCRDVREALPQVAARVERLGALFGEYRAVFYENDSADGTPAFLRAWSEANPAVEVLSERRGFPRYGQVRSLDRAARMAFYRNRCRGRVLERFGDFDEVIVMDLDLEGGWSYDGIAHTFGQDGWDFVGSNGLQLRPRHGPRPIPFDAWAYRPVGVPESLPGRDFYDLRLGRGAALVPVWSCFGGLGVYRMACWKDAAYHGDDNEHAAFHRELRGLGHDRFFLNPSQIVLYDTYRGESYP